VSYTVTSAGNRTSMTNKLANVTLSYPYDLIYQLAEVTQSVNATESYSYNQVDDRLGSRGISSDSGNTSNELTATSNAI
jgi:hypothetical protein